MTRHSRSGRFLIASARAFLNDWYSTVSPGLASALCGSDIVSPVCSSGWSKLNTCAAELSVRIV